MERYQRIVRVGLLSTLILTIFTSLFTPLPTHAASDDWIAIEVTNIQVGARNWGPLDGNADLRLLMIVQHDDDPPMGFDYPSSGTLSVAPYSSVALGNGGLVVTAPEDSHTIRVALIAMDDDQPSDTFDLGTGAFLSFVSNKLVNHLKELIDKIKEIAEGLGEFVEWFIGYAAEESATLVVQYFEQNDEIGDSALVLDAYDNWSADGKEHTVTSSNGEITFTYEVRVAKRQSAPARKPTPTSDSNNTPGEFREYNKQLDSDAYCISCHDDKWEWPPMPGAYSWREAAPANTPLLFSMGWCAVDDDTLRDNWRHMHYRLSIDHTDVDISEFTPVYSVGNNQSCYFYKGVLSGWSPGWHSYTWTQYIDRNVYDGQVVSRAGYYIMQFNVAVQD